MTLYERIRKLRIEKGMTQDDLAHAMGYKDRSMITKIESGKVDISQKKVDTFAKVLNTSPAYLMGWIDDKRTTRERIEEVFNEASGKINNQSPQSKEARIISGGIDKLPKEQRERALAMFRVMFEPQYADLFTKESDDNDDT